MLGRLHGVLAEFSSTVAEPLGWLTLAVFLVAIALEYVDREYSRPVFVVAWLLFAVFWFALIEPFFVKDDSFIRGAGAVLAVPLSVLVAKMLYEGRDSLFTLSRAIAFMGLIYAPFLMVPVLREQLILIVVDHTQWAMSLVGYDPPLVTELSEVGVERTIDSKEYAYENSFVFSQDSGGTITYTIIIDCTGIGSMAVIAGLVASVTAPLDRKLRALAIALPIIYVLNIVRNVFIALNFGHQWAHFFPDITMSLFALDNELMVSYIWADRVLAQTGSVIAMVLIFWLVVRELPEVMDPVEDVIYLLTGEEYDLAAALNIDHKGSPDPEAAD